MYLDPLGFGIYKLHLYYNYEKFETDKYGDEAIKKTARVSEVLLDAKVPKRLNFNYQSYLLEDQSELFQFHKVDKKFYHGPAKTTDFQ